MDDGAFTPVIEARDVSRTYGTGPDAVTALAPCSLTLEAGTITVVVGPSGSGKSTLLHLLAGLEAPTTGSVRLGAVRLDELREAERARWRARHAGFVLQRDNLIPSLSLEENVAAPLILGGMRQGTALARARATLELVGLSERTGAWPVTLSGGEALRGTVARACAGSPRVVFADEPTGALDAHDTAAVLDLLAALTRRRGAATLLVTHDPAATRVADRVVRIEAGRLRTTATPWARSA